MCQMRGSITSRVHRAWLVSGMWWVTSPSEDPLMDLCKVQLMRRLRSKFRSNFLHVIARTLVLVNVCSPD
jgi:hypothetical protein